MRRIRLFAGVLVVLGLILGIQASSAVAQSPVIDSITPDHGSTLSPTNVTINGSNFEQGAEVSLFPGGPHIKGSVNISGSVYVSGSYAYVAGGSGLQVIDISTPSNPVIIGSYYMPGGNMYDVYVSGNYAYVPSGADLHVIDISIPYGPSIDSILLDSNVGNSTTITAAIPANLPDGVYNIIVTNPSGEVGTLPNGYRVVDGIVDNIDPGFSVQGTWGINSNNVVPGVYDKNFHFSAPGDGSDTAVWDAELVNGAGNYEVFVWYPVYSGLAANAPFTINHAGISDTLIVDQGINGGQWVSLGLFDFIDDGTENIAMSDNADSWVAADAVRFSPVSME